MSNVEFLKKVNQQIEALDKQLNALNSEIAKLSAKKADLVVTKRVLSDYFGVSDVDSAADDPGDEGRRGTISDEILRVLNRRGPLTKVEIYEYLETVREGISITTVSTTLSRMKDQDKIDNREGKWLVA